MGKVNILLGVQVLDIELSHIHIESPVKYDADFSSSFSFKRTQLVLK